MNRMGRDTVSVVMDKLPILNKVRPLFRLILIVLAFLMPL